MVPVDSLGDLSSRARDLSTEYRGEVDIAIIELTDQSDLVRVRLAIAVAVAIVLVIIAHDLQPVLVRHVGESIKDSASWL